MARQDSYSNDVQITGTDRVTGIDGITGRTNNFLFSTISSFIGAQFSISGNTITLPDGRTFDTGITSLLGVSLTNLPTAEPTTAGLPWRQGQFIKLSGQSTDSLEVVSTGAGNGVGPLVDLYRNSSSPATSDVIGGIRFSGNNSTGVKTNYGQVNATIDTTSGNGSIVAAPSIAGVPTSAVTISGSSTSVNNTLVLSGQTIFSNPSITLAALPTTDPGISGRLWNDGGTPVLSGSTSAPVVSTTATAIIIDGVSTNYPGNTGGEANVQSDWNETTTTDDSYIQNKPRIELSGTTNVVAGGLTINSLPTTDPGTTNRLWNDGGVIRISGTTTISTTVVETTGNQAITGEKTFENMLRVGSADGFTTMRFSGNRGVASSQGLIGDIGPSAIFGGVGISITTLHADGDNVSGVTVNDNGFNVNTGNLILPDTVGIVFGTQATTTVTGSTSTSKTLDDYEEGTWTPVPTNFNATDGTTTFSPNSGTSTSALNTATTRYTKIGDVVHLEAVLYLPNNTDGSGFIVQGIPFIHLPNEGAIGTWKVGNSSGTVEVLATLLSFRNFDGTSFNYDDYPPSTGSIQPLRFSITYKTTA